MYGVNVTIVWGQCNNVWGQSKNYKR